jgi:DHA2 family multidrug resistance protein-like MFS transporter
MVLGPLVGGLLLEVAWWGAVFLMAVPVMVLLLVTAPSLLPEHRDEQAGRLDLVSVVLSLGTILPVVFALKEFAKDGLSLVSVAVLLAGLAVGVAFVRRQRVLAEPMLDLKLFRNRTFTAALSIVAVSALVMGGVFLVVSQYLQLVAGLSPVQAGAVLVPQALAVVAGSLIAPKLVRRIRPEIVLGFGMLVAAGGLVLFTQVGTNGVVLVALGMSIAAFGMGPQGVVCTEMVVSSVPPRKAGAASAMSETAGEFGIAMGIAVFGSIGTAVYRGELHLPAGTPAEATESIASAANVAAGLDQRVAAEVLTTAREAFTSGLHTVATIGGIVVVAFAVVGMVALRHKPAAQAEPTAEQGEQGEPVAEQGEQGEPVAEDTALAR